MFKNRPDLYSETNLKQQMRWLGRATPGQLRRLWPRVLDGLHVEGTHPPSVWPSVSILIMIALFALSSAAFFGGPTHVSAAPGQIVPADIRATNTPVHTDEPDIVNTDSTAVASASQTASPFVRAQASPAPPPINTLPVAVKR